MQLLYIHGELRLPLAHELRLIRSGLAIDQPACQDADDDDDPE